MTPLKREITDFVETHVLFRQDPFVDYPSFFYRIIWHGEEYRGTSRESIINDIMEEELK